MAGMMLHAGVPRVEIAGPGPIPALADAGAQRVEIRRRARSRWSVPGPGALLRWRGGIGGRVPLPPTKIEKRRKSVEHRVKARRGVRSINHLNEQIGSEETVL